jgi:starch synthase
VFYQTDRHALESALGRALHLYKENPAAFKKLAQQGMAYDYSWNHPGAQYVGVYEYIRHR